MTTRAYPNGFPVSGKRMLKQVSLFLMLVDAISYVVKSNFLKTFFEYISFNERYSPFTLGIIELQNVLFFLTIAALFIAISTALLERKRWN